MLVPIVGIVVAGSASFVCGKHLCIILWYHQ